MEPHKDENVLQDIIFDIHHNLHTPDETLEQSVADRDSDDPEPDSVVEVTFEEIVAGTKRGGRKLISSDGYTYTVKRSNAFYTHWTCSVRSKKMRCPAFVKQYGNDRYVRSSTIHIHQRDPSLMTKVKMSTKIKQLALDNIDKPAAQLVQEVMRECTTTDFHDLPRVQNLTRAINRQRQKHEGLLPVMSMPVLLKDDAWKNQLMVKMEKMRQSKLFCDGQLIGQGGASHPVHTCVLAASSDHLSSLVATSVSPKFSLQLDLSEDAIECLLQFIYTGEVSIRMESLADLELVAAELGIIRLEMLCRKLTKGSSHSSSVRQNRKIAPQNTSSGDMEGSLSEEEDLDASSVEIDSFVDEDFTESTAREDQLSRASSDDNSPSKPPIENLMTTDKPVIKMLSERRPSRQRPMYRCDHCGYHALNRCDFQNHVISSHGVDVWNEEYSDCQQAEENSLESDETNDKPSMNLPSNDVSNTGGSQPAAEDDQNDLKSSSWKQDVWNEECCDCQQAEENSLESDETNDKPSMNLPSNDVSNTGGSQPAAEDDQNDLKPSSWKQDTASLSGVIVVDIQTDDFEQIRLPDTSEQVSEETSSVVKCPVCDYVPKRPSYLSKHMKVHMIERPHKCEECGKGFRRKNDLTKHSQVHNPDSWYECGTCKKRFNFQTGLLQHLRTHSGERPYRCKTCGLNFTCYTDLRRHKWIHTGYKPYKCSTCGMGFIRRQQLHIHENTHSGQKPYLCNYCGISLSTRNSHAAHERKHTGERPYQCAACDQTHFSAKNLRRHQVVAHGHSNFPLHPEKVPKS